MVGTDLRQSARAAAGFAKTLRVDLFSDTNSKPTRAMRDAMANADCGNEQALEDPTTNALQERIADLLGKPAAMFLPSGSMCNEIAYRVWGRHGDAILMDKTGHALLYETGGPAALSGLMISIIDGTDGMFDAAHVDAAAASVGRHAPRPRILNIENTTNLGGGRVWSLDGLADVAQAARKHGLAVHMDGARLLNASVQSGQSPAVIAECADSVWIDLSKGLGCPIGAVLAGPEDFIDEAFRMKHQFGGALRQSGIVTAAGLYALDHHVARLSDDHDNARRLHTGLGEISDISLQNDVCETNIVFFDVGGTGKTAPDIAAQLAERGIRIGAFSETKMRAVTHLDVDTDGIDLALAAMRDICA